MDQQSIALVQASFQQVLPIADQAAIIFYDKLFEKDPSLRKLFPEDLTDQRRKLMTMLTMAVKGLSNLESLVPIVQNLGNRHAGYGVKTGMYETVGEALLETLEVGLGSAFSQEVKQAWTEVYQLLASTMQQGAAVPQV